MRVESECRSGEVDDNRKCEEVVTYIQFITPLVRAFVVLAVVFIGYEYPVLIVIDQIWNVMVVATGYRAERNTNGRII